MNLALHCDNSLCIALRMKATGDFFIHTLCVELISRVIELEP